MTVRSQPPYRADHVGSLLRPAKLIEARNDFDAGRIDVEALRLVEDDAIREAVRMQEDVGLQVATDGEFRRASWHMDFVYQLGGISQSDEHMHVTFHNEAGDVEFNPAHSRVHGKVRLEHTIFGDHFEMLASVVDHATPKLTIPSPSMVHYRGGRPRSTSPSIRISSSSGLTSASPTPRRCGDSPTSAARTSSSTTRPSRTSTTPSSGKR